ncbi:hypothetical protein AB833_31955 [Chromatiales bacterium (ex Bugula neritina AB1)]|nr:hypothetical protein AB833_31955 [Chromatiales bacterium (ex Bugula neritina AB1)]
MKIDHTRLQRLESLAVKHTKSGEFSSIEWRVSHREQVVASGIRGKADALTNADLPVDPIYRIYSMTKPIVSVIALQLIEEGVLSLATPVAMYLPAVAEMQVLNGAVTTPVKEVMTVEHLLTHRAGFSYDFLPDCPVAVAYRAAHLAETGTITLQELVDSLIDKPLCFEPGSAWKYSYSIDVLARVLELATGVTLPELLCSRVLEPCGMTNTGFTVSSAEQHRLLPMFGQRLLGAEMVAVTDPQRLYPLDCDTSHPVHDHNFVRGGHGLYSTADDYMRFLPVLMTGRTANGDPLLSAPMVELMWNNRIPQRQQPLKIGLNQLAGYGWSLFGRVMVNTGQAMQLTMQGEGGWAGAAATYFWVDREREFSGLVMTQYLGATVPVGEQFSTAAYQSLV